MLDSFIHLRIKKRAYEFLCTRIHKNHTTRKHTTCLILRRGCVRYYSRKRVWALYRSKQQRRRGTVGWCGVGFGKKALVRRERNRVGVRALGSTRGGCSHALNMVVFKRLWSSLSLLLFLTSYLLHTCLGIILYSNLGRFIWSMMLASNSIECMLVCKQNR